MVIIKIGRLNGSIAKVECVGHSGYGVEGEDIVCSAVSSIVQTALLGILGVAKVNTKYKIDEALPSFKFTIPADISKQERTACDNILETMLLGLSDLYRGYSDFIELEVQ